MTSILYNKKMNERTITITLEDGSTVDGEVLFTFELNGDNFILYELEEKIFAARIDEEDNLSQVNEDEWPMIEKIYNQYIEDQEKE